MNNLLVLSFLMLFINNPLILSILILLFALNVTYYLTFLTNSSWFSYILFIIMIGGLLILFVYMSSMSSTNKFKFHYFYFFTLFFLSIDFKFLIYNENSLNFLNDKSLNFMIKFFNYPNMYLIMFLIIYLLLMLIIVFFLVDVNLGPFRKN
uniref:NADH dehydrogenase subunit 6 n=1 Tax=Cerophytidae sp. BMNH 900085 TaxID=1903808 RepID=A0A343A4J3_9COLE|nr:NADH dehydrogenase subunit 6 [Cerophytidae sp. BMNH 900085]